jgi:hypothetical protein
MVTACDDAQHCLGNVSRGHLRCDFVYGVTGPCFRLCTSARFLTKHEERIPTSSDTSRDQAGYGKRTACHCRRQPRRGTSSTCLVLDPSHNKKRENPYFVSYIQRPSGLWQTNSVPLSETAPPWDQFHLIPARSARDRKEKIPTSSDTSRDPAGYGKRTACHCRRQRHRGTSSTCLVLDLSDNKKREKSLLRCIHPKTKLAMANE